MNCREFEKLWGDVLDARWAAPAHLEGDLEAHASACPRCRAASDRYRLLRRAIAGLRPPAPSPASIHRLYALAAPASPPRVAIGPSRPGHRPWKPLAAAAAFALAWLGGDRWPGREPDPRPATTRTATPVESARPLGFALAEATEATLDLAREASAPASRIGREVLGLGRLSASRTDVAPVLVEDLGRIVEAESAPPGLFKAVGERVGAGVGPISGSARHAFSFLLGPPEESGNPPPVPDGRDGL